MRHTPLLTCLLCLVVGCGGDGVYVAPTPGASCHDQAECAPGLRCVQSPTPPSHGRQGVCLVPCRAHVDCPEGRFCASLDADDPTLVCHAPRAQNQGELRPTDLILVLDPASCANHTRAADAVSRALIALTAHDLDVQLAVVSTAAADPTTPLLRDAPGTYSEPCARSDCGPSTDPILRVVDHRDPATGQFATDLLTTASSCLIQIGDTDAEPRHLDALQRLLTEQDETAGAMLRPDALLGVALLGARADVSTATGMQVDDTLERLLIEKNAPDLEDPRAAARLVATERLVVAVDDVLTDDAHLTPVADADAALDALTDWAVRTSSRRCLQVVPACTTDDDCALEDTCVHTPTATTTTGVCSGFGRVVEVLEDDGPARRLVEGVDYTVSLDAADCAVSGSSAVALDVLTPLAPWAQLRVGSAP